MKKDELRRLKINGKKGWCKYVFPSNIEIEQLQAPCRDYLTCDLCPFWYRFPERLLMYRKRIESASKPVSKPKKKRKIDKNYWLKVWRVYNKFKYKINTWKCKWENENHSQSI